MRLYFTIYLVMGGISAITLLVAGVPLKRALAMVLWWPLALFWGIAASLSSSEEAMEHWYQFVLSEEDNNDA